MAIIKRLFLRSGLITLILLQLGCVFVLYHHATSSSSSLTSGGGSSGVGISGLTGLINLKSLKLFLSDPALQKINVSSPEIYPLKDQDASDYFRYAHVIESLMDRMRIEAEGNIL